MMERWFQILRKLDTPYYDRLPVLIDNAYYASGNGKFDNVVQNNDFFITGWFDTDTTARKTYTMSLTLTPQGVQLYARWFNTTGVSSADYFYCGANTTGTSRNVNNAPGRFVAVSIRKSEAANMFAYRTVNGVRQYLYKGSNVTD